MFYEGSLQEGISTAVGQQKLVLCFVTGRLVVWETYVRAERTRLTGSDGNDESQKWENDFLQDESVSSGHLEHSGGHAYLSS